MTSDWEHNSSAAAPTGEIETTTEINCYKSAEGDNAMPYARLWDIPGCGTIKCPMQDYFMRKSLYAFDCLIVVSEGTLHEPEMDLIDVAGACNRPVIVVLTKAELKAESKARDTYDTTNVPAAVYELIVLDTIKEAKESMWAMIEEAKSKYRSLKVSEVFVVSPVKYRDFLKSGKEVDALLSFETSKLLVYLLETGIENRVR